MLKFGVNDEKFVGIGSHDEVVAFSKKLGGFCGEEVDTAAVGHRTAAFKTIDGSNVDSFEGVGEGLVGTIEEDV